MPLSIDRLDLHSDERGVVFEPLEPHHIEHQKNVHVVTIRPGVIRGNHYHQSGTETITVLGPALVRFRENDELREIDIPVQQAYRFVFPPEIPHAIQNTGEETNILIAFNTEPHDAENPDVVPAVLIED